MKCGNCGRSIREANAGRKIRYTHQMTGYFCYKSGPEHAEPYLIEERP